MFRALQAAFVVVACTLYLGSSCAHENQSADAAQQEVGTPQDEPVGGTAARSELGTVVPDASVSRYRNTVA